METPSSTSIATPPPGTGLIGSRGPFHRRQLPDSVTPEAVAFGVGVVIGAIGKKAAQGKFTWFAVIFAVVEQLVVRFSLSVVPEAIKLTKEEYAKLAKEIIEKVKEAGVTLDALDADKILKEVQQHPKEIKEAFDMMKSAFEKHVKTKAATSASGGGPDIRSVNSDRAC